MLRISVKVAFATSTFFRAERTLRVKTLGARASGPHVFFHRDHSEAAPGLALRAVSPLRFISKWLCAGGMRRTQACAPRSLAPLLRIPVTGGSVQPFARTIVTFVWATQLKICRRCTAIGVTLQKPCLAADKVSVRLDRLLVDAYYSFLLADVAELVDAQRSGRCGSNLVEVRVLSSAY